MKAMAVFIHISTCIIHSIFGVFWDTFVGKNFRINRKENNKYIQELVLVNILPLKDLEGTLDLVKREVQGKVVCQPNFYG